MDPVIQKLKSGDAAVYRTIVKNRYSYFYRLACTYVRDEEMAKEIVQDVFIKLWEGSASLDDDTVLDSFLATLVRNKSIDYIRSRKLQLQKQEEYSQACMDDTEGEYWVEHSKLCDYSYDDLLLKAQSVIAELPEQTRNVFIMHRMEGLKYKDISEKLGVSSKAIEYHMSKALKMLKEKLMLFLFF